MALVKCYFPKRNQIKSFEEHLAKDPQHQKAYGFRIATPEDIAAVEGASARKEISAVTEQPIASEKKILNEKSPVADEPVSNVDEVEKPKRGRKPKSETVNN